MPRHDGRVHRTGDYVQEIFAAVILNLVIKGCLPYKVLTGAPTPTASEEPLSLDDEPFWGLSSPSASAALR